MHRPATRRLVLSFYVFQIAAGTWMIVRPVLPGLENDASSLKWALISLTPLLWLASIDYAGYFRRARWSTASDSETTSISFKNVASPAIFLCVLYAVICYFRFRGMLSFSKTEILIIGFWTIISHLLIFLGAFVALNLARSLATRFRESGKAFFILSNCVAGLFGALVVRYLILSGISFDGLLSNAYALAAAGAVTLFVSGIKLRHRSNMQSDPLEKEDGQIDITKRRGVPAFLNLLKSRAAWFAGLIVLAYVLPASVARMDWDFLMQKLSVVAIWTAAFALWHSTKNTNATRRAKPYPVRGLILVIVASFGVYKLISASESRLPRLLRNDELNVNATLEAYATYDISFKVAHQVLTNIADFSLRRFLQSSGGVVPTASAAPGEPAESTPNEDNGFYVYLKKNTNLMPAVKVDPVEVKLVDDLKRSTGFKPNIFVFVVDSLRPDYLSPYNDKVSFTPNIDAFASESIVMENAFTPYGGTVLAEPSIWTGTMQIHKQFVEPFYPMNSLQKLIEVENYQPMITIDPVLKIILKPSSSIIELDKGMDGWQGLDLNNTLRELRTKMEERQDKSRPIFAYTQAQNLHIHRLNRERNSGVAAYEIPGFDSYYLSQIKHIDEGIGEFIQYLKDSGQYDNSVVILTSDHGDSIGEGGRWGHANWIFPEVLKIPIIVHLPSKYQKDYYWNSRSIAFSSDLTPSLYYLLGHRPLVKNEIFGKPLFTLSQKEQSDYQKRSYMVASSYGPSYGILSDNGQSLFISDAGNSRDYFFNLKADPKGTRNLVTGEIRAENEKLIRRNVDAINNFYHFVP